MVVRSGVGGVIHADRLCGLPCVEFQRRKPTLRCLRHLCHSLAVECAMDTVVLRLSQSWLGFGVYHCAMAGDSAQHRGVLSHQTGCGFTVGARFVVGHVCVAVEYVDLDIGPVM